MAPCCDYCVSNGSLPSLPASNCSTHLITGSADPQILLMFSVLQKILMNFKMDKRRLITSRIHYSDTNSKVHTPLLVYIISVLIHLTLPICVKFNCVPTSARFSSLVAILLWVNMHAYFIVLSHFLPGTVKLYSRMPSKFLNLQHLVNSSREI